MKSSEVLTKALELLGPNGEHWTKGAFGRNADGQPVAARGPDAVSWCASGALVRVNPSGWSYFDPYVHLRNVAEETFGSFGSIVNMNDSSDFPCIQAAFHKAIQKALEAGD